jgi:hypothetical protein
MHCWGEGDRVLVHYKSMQVLAQTGVLWPQYGPVPLQPSVILYYTSSRRVGAYAKGRRIIFDLLKRIVFESFPVTRGSCVYLMPCIIDYYSSVFILMCVLLLRYYGRA